MVVDVRCDQTSLIRVASALRLEADGRSMRTDLIRNLRAAAAPAVAQIRANLAAIPSKGRSGQPLRAAVASTLRVQVRLGGRFAGVKIRNLKTPGIRKFANAPKRLNRKAGWRHPVFGSDTWMHQRAGKPEFFDAATRAHRGDYEVAVGLALQATAARIQARAGAS